MSKIARVSPVVMGRTSYINKIKSLFGANLIAYWPMNEASGTAAVNYGSIGTAGNGTYSNVDLANTAGPSKVKHLTPLFDGTNNDVLNAISAALIAAFNGNLGSWFMWLKVQSAGVWTDGTRRDPGFIATTGNASFLSVRKNVGNNSMSVYRDDTGSAQNVDITISLTTWFNLGMTWSQAANQFIVYLNGAQTGLTKTCAAWDAGSVAVAAIGSTAANGATNRWSGWACEHMIMNRVVTPTEAALIYSLGA